MFENIEFHETSSGRMPAQKFLNGIKNGDVIVKFDWIVQKLKKYPLEKLILESKFVGVICKKPVIYDIKFRMDKKWFRFPFIAYGKTATIIDGFTKDTNEIEKHYLDRAIKTAALYNKKR